MTKINCENKRNIAQHENVNKIANTIFALKKDTTIIIITHTPKHFEKYDQIIDLSKMTKKKKN